MEISFLTWFDPTTWLSGVERGIMGSIVSGLRTLFYTITEVIYGIIIFLYEMFEVLCTSRILNNEMLSEFTKRVGIILGLIMLFNVIFSFIKMLIDPEQLENKDTGAAAIIRKTLITIVLLGVSSFAFLQLYNIQTIIVKEHVISKLLLPVTVSNTDDFGRMLSAGLLTSFYQIEEVTNGTIEDREGEELKATCEGYYTALRNQIINNGKFDLGYTCLNESVEVLINSGSAEGDYHQEVYLMYFNWFLCIAAGIGVCYLLAMYCIQVGVRMVQLAFLEIISPMAIVSYISPKKETMFSKWLKIYIATYIDVFIRIAIINFVVLIIATLFTTDQHGIMVFMSELGNSIDSKTKSFFIVVIILALLTFAKKAPDLLKELLPAGASKLGFGGVGFKDMLGGKALQKGLTTGAKVATAGAAIGFGGALLSGASRFRANWKNGKGFLKSTAGFLGGALTAVPRGFIAGGKKGNVFSNISKGFNEQRSIDDKYDDLIASGGSQIGKLGAKISSYVGETRGQAYTRHVKANESVVNATKRIEDAAEGFKDVKIAKTSWENAKARGESDTAIQSAYDNYKRIKKKRITQALEGRVRFAEAEDNSIAANMSVDKAEIINLVKTNQVNLKDENGHKIERFDDYTAINNASISASSAIADIKNAPDYSAAIANDRAAGVDSNASKK